MTFSFHGSMHQEPPILIPAIGLDLRVSVPPDTTGGALTSIETTNAPDFGPPLHWHRETEEGDVVIAPGGSAHTFVNISDQPARQLIQILPGLDATAFLLGLPDVMRDGKLDRDALNAFGARWHVEFLGPP